MNLPDNLPADQQLIPWRSDLQRLRAVDGWALTSAENTPLLIPVQGKNPGFAGPGWQHKRHTIEELADHPRATGVGLITGPQPTGDSVVAFDFDGLPGVQFAFNNGVDPTAASTWTIARTDPDGTDTPGRFKLLFRPTPEQRARLTDACGYSLAIETVDLGDGRSKREGLELWHSPAKQMVILGDHPDGGRYYWPAGHGPEALAPLPDDWMRLALAVIEAVVQGCSVDEEPTIKSARKKAWGSTKEWRRMKRGESCPICNRDGKGSTHTCARLDQPGRDRDVIRCFDGFSFSYRAAHPGLKPNDTITGTDGRLWYFSSEQHIDGFGMRGNFREHRPRQPSLPPATPQPTGIAAIDHTQPSHSQTSFIDQLLETPNFVHEITGATPHDPAAAQQIIDLLPSELDNGAITPDSLRRAAQQLIAAVDPGPDPSIPAALRIDHPGADRTTAQHRLEQLAADAGRLDAIAGNDITSTSVLTVLRSCPQLVGLASRDPLITAADWKRLARAARIESTAAVRQERQAQAQSIAQRDLDTLLDGWTGGPLSPGRSWIPVVAAFGIRTPDTNAQGDPRRITTAELRKHFRRIGAEPRAATAQALRWNLIRNAIEYTTPAGETYELPPELVETLHTNLCEAGWESSKQQVMDCLVSQAREDAYNPVAQYLNLLEHDHQLAPIPPEQVAELVLGITDPLQQVFVAKWLISAVARALQPGCKADAMLVLQGRQGQGKSTFFAELAPTKQWFSNDKPANEKDLQLLFHRCWIYEYAELDGLTRAKESDEVKRLLSTATDRIRPPYGSTEREMHRPSIMGGTCNRTDFLTDETGSRRFWVVDMRDSPRTRDQIAQLLEQHRDAIWRGALAAYRNGQPWHLAADEEATREIHARDFVPENASEDVIATWLTTLPLGAVFKTTTALVNSGAVRDASQAGGRRESDRAARALRDLGWELVPRKIDIGHGRRSIKVWRRIGSEIDRLAYIPMQGPHSPQQQTPWPVQQAESAGHDWLP